MLLGLREGERVEGERGPGQPRIFRQYKTTTTDGGKGEGKREGGGVHNKQASKRRQRKRERGGAQAVLPPSCLPASRLLPLARLLAWLAGMPTTKWEGRERESAEATTTRPTNRQASKAEWEEAPVHQRQVYVS